MASDRQQDLGGGALIHCLVALCCPVQRQGEVEDLAGGDRAVPDQLDRAFYSPVIGDGGRVPNLARFQFLDPASRDFYPDWDRFAEMCVGIMRTEAGRDPHDRGLQDLVGEFSTQSDVFRRLWADHNVRIHGAGTERFTHPVVGDLTLAYEELAITAEPGLVLLVYTAEPGSPSAERLRLLASWAATAVAAQSPDDTSAGPSRRSTRSAVRDTEGT